MPKFRICPDCGCNIDFGEICDCRKEKTATDAGTSAAAGLIKAKPYTTTKISLMKENVKCQ